MCQKRGTFIVPVDVNAPVFGLYSSATAVVPDEVNPPAISTFPFGSNVAVWPDRPVTMLPVNMKVPELGS